MNTPNVRFWPVLFACGLLAGCQAARPVGAVQRLVAEVLPFQDREVVVPVAIAAERQATEGDYVAFVLDAMVESARLKVADGDGVENSEGAMSAVRAWRGEGEDDG